MIHRLLTLRNRLTEELMRAVLHGIEPDTALDRRDEVEFEEAWNFTYDELHARDGELDESSRREILATEERAHKLVFDAVGHPELAGCVADDLGLIAAAVALEVDDEFAIYLLEEYLNGCLPVMVGAAESRSFLALLDAEP